MYGIESGDDVRVRFPVYAIRTDMKPSKHSCRLTFHMESATVVRVYDQQTVIVRFRSGGLAPVHISTIDEIL